MRGGVLKNLLKIERRVQAGKDSLGQPIIDWVLFKRLYGQVVAYRGAEAMSADFQRYQSTVYRFRVRRAEVAGVDATMRLVFDGGFYDIRALLPDEQNRQDAMIEATIQNRTI